jgi:hypothetical protein
MRSVLSSQRRGGAVARAVMLALMAAVIVSISSTARAEEGAFAPRPQPGGGFGAPGQWVITGDFEAHFHSGYQLRVHPALDYFIVPNVSVGGVLGLTYTSGSPSQTEVDVGARAGYNLNVNNQISFWPMAGIFFTHLSGRPDTNSTVFHLFAPFLFDLVPHLFVGLGPSFNIDLSGGGTSWGIDSIVGGWF